MHATPNLAVLARLRKFSHGAMAMVFFTAMSGWFVSLSEIGILIKL